MPANNTPATAVDITSLPFSTTLDPGGPEQFTDVPSCNGTAFSPIWYKYTVPVGITAIGINLEISPAGDYYPQFSAWLGTPGSLTEISNICSIFFDPSTFQISLTPGETYYFQIVDGNENDPPPVGQTITFELEEAPNEIAPAGSLIISNDFANLPACILNATDGTILRILGWPAFECAYVLPTGIIGAAVEKTDDSFEVESFTIFNQNLSVLISETSVITSPTQGPICPVTSNKVDNFYLAVPDNSAPGSYRTIVYKITADGTVDPTNWTLPIDGDGTPAVCVNPSETILYYCDGTFAPSTTVGAIHRYDLVNDLPLSDLVAPALSESFGRDLYYLNDDTLLVLTRVAGVYEARQYDTSGTLLETIVIPVSSGSPRMCPALDDPDSFWIMTFSSGPVTNTFTNILISDGSTIDSFAVLQRSDLTSDGPMFGPAQSCPLLLLPLEVTPVDPVIRNAYSGIYQLIPGKTNDTVIEADESQTDVAIPNPFIESSFIGDD